MALSSAVITIMIELVLFGLALLFVQLSKSYDGFIVFNLTLAIGMFILLITTTINYIFNKYQEAKTKRILQENIVTGYCPDYWTKSFDEQNNVVCKNGFASTLNGDLVRYTFSDPKVPSSISLNTITNSANTSKCNMYGNDDQFPAPWLEMKVKCDKTVY
jgi:hypothetical protein